jgi:hypothetical protein
MRKIIQISTESQPSNEDWEAWYTTTALCDDGTLWELTWDFSKEKKVWTKLPDIPQTGIKF